MIQMLIGMEIKKNEEEQLVIFLKYLVPQSHGARESDMWWNYHRVKPSI